MFSAVLQDAARKMFHLKAKQQLVKLVSQGIYPERPATIFECHKAEESLPDN